MPFTNTEEKVLPYHVIVRKYWFRQKPVFTQQFSYYETLLRNHDSVKLTLDAGNMIYLMMRRLPVGDWTHQNALIHSYRNLMYKMSYVDVFWEQKNMQVLHIKGQKSDVLWALSFVSQLYPDNPIDCWSVPDSGEQSLKYQIKDGMYVGENAVLQSSRDSLPDVWSMEEEQQLMTYAAMPSAQMQYDPNFRPVNEDLFALPDGRVGEYIDIDTRFVLANKFGSSIDAMKRHNISASFIKDFEDMVRRQKTLDYETYRIRYQALMNKVHQLEHVYKGLEVSIYNILPVAERGLPQAPMDTIKRTNWMDRDSLTYVIDKVKRNRHTLNSNESVLVMKDAAKSIIARIRGYNTEYQMYQMTQTPEDLCRIIRQDSCVNLYEDFVSLEALQVLNFTAQVYRVLCNDPQNSAYAMTDMEKDIKHKFGDGYASFLNQRIAENQNNPGRLRIYHIAKDRLVKRYLNAERV